MIFFRRRLVIKKVLIFTYLTLLNCLLLKIPTYAIEEDPLNNPIDTENVLENKIDATKYILGSGDNIQINFYGLEIFSGEHVIDPQGNIFLPEINFYKAEGKTLEELKKDLELVYDEYINDPQIDIFVKDYRPISFYLAGEIRNPGLYKLPISDKKFPTLFEVLKLGEGFNNKADLTNLKVIRMNPDSQGGGKIKADIDLISLFNSGDQSANISIYDGDTIVIPKSELPMKDQILKINRTNITPEMITVFVTGNATTKGRLTVKRGSSLIQAIASSGGKKLHTGKIEFIRFNYDGTVSKDIFAYNPNAKIDSKNNPILMDGDLIHMRKTLIGTANEYLGEFASPILSLYGLYNLVGDIVD